MSKINIKKAIVSVSDKNLLNKIGKYFLKYNIVVLSTGGTYKFLKKNFPDLKIKEISAFTNLILFLTLLRIWKILKHKKFEYLSDLFI